ncbi:hypothetical protein B0I35DRAFT_125767 [Stachybotrys elegans]|uniref:Uncharacterized protein n=1 Tax=Stachybotrys elegans TaxID=80388 RepID=A0A8K0SY01_9HYPO|nr:hypothetical protein B0I35DRAFT_125767 [Stachybotrys elegans]
MEMNHHYNHPSVDAQRCTIRSCQNPVFISGFCRSHQTVLPWHRHVRAVPHFRPRGPDTQPDTGNDTLPVQNHQSIPWRTTELPFKINLPVSHGDAQRTSIRDPVSGTGGLHQRRSQAPTVARIVPPSAVVVDLTQSPTDFTVNSPSAPPASYPQVLSAQPEPVQPGFQPEHIRSKQVQLHFEPEHSRSRQVQLHVGPEHRQSRQVQLHVGPEPIRPELIHAEPVRPEPAQREPSRPEPDHPNPNPTNTKPARLPARDHAAIVQTQWLKTMGYFSELQAQMKTQVPDRSQVEDPSSEQAPGATQQQEIASHGPQDSSATIVPARNPSPSQAGTSSASQASFSSATGEPSDIEKVSEPEKPREEPGTSLPITTSKRAVNPPDTFTFVASTTRRNIRKRKNATATGRGKPRQYTRRVQFNPLVFDRLIYQQESAATPPREVRIALDDAQRRAGESRSAVDDLTTLHFEAWYENKLKEIQSRGGRKAWFGKVLQRQRWLSSREGRGSNKQGERHPPPRLRRPDFSDVAEEDLPDYVLRDPAWVKACAWHRQVRRRLHLLEDERQRQEIQTKRYLARVLGTNLDTR